MNWSVRFSANPLSPTPTRVNRDERLFLVFEPEKTELLKICGKTGPGFSSRKLLNVILSFEDGAYPSLSLRLGRKEEPEDLNNPKLIEFIERKLIPKITDRDTREKYIIRLRNSVLSVAGAMISGVSPSRQHGLGGAH